MMIPFISADPAHAPDRRHFLPCLPVTRMPDANPGSEAVTLLKCYSCERGFARPAITMAVLLIAAAAGLFLLMDDGQVEHAVAVDKSHPVGEPAMSRAMAVSHSLPTVENMLGQLEKRLQQEPGDAAGWSLLGKSYEYLGRHAEALQAFDRAKSLGYIDAAGHSVKASVVKGTVQIDQAVMGNVSMTDTVFVFARAVNGPRMPLAILRRPASEIPFEFELDDSMAISPQAKLSGFRDVIVGARISSSGDATAREGDLEGYSGIVEVGNEADVSVMIGQAVIR